MASFVYSFCVSESDKELIKYINKLKENRRLSYLISKFLKEDMENTKSILKLKQELKETKTKSQNNINDIKEAIDKLNITYKDIFKEIMDRLKENYSVPEKKLSNVSEFISNRSEFLSKISGESKEQLITKITNEISKWKKKN